MTRAKKIFTAFAIVFALLLGYVVYDISSRTTFPGRSSTEQDTTPVDTVAADDGRVNRP